MTSNLSLGSQGHNFASLVKDNPFLEILGKQLERVGTGFAIIDIAMNMAEGKDLEAGLGSVKLVTGWALGKFATLGTKIAGIGAFFIEYSLNTLARETFAAQYAGFEKAYEAYYKSEGRSEYGWYEEIKAILIEYDTSPEQVNVVINKSIDDYVKSIWGDYAAFEGYLADARGHGWTADGGLNDTIKGQLEANHKVALRKTIKSTMTKAFEWIKAEAYSEKWNAEYKVQSYLNQPIRFWVDVFGNKKNDKLDVVVLHENTPILVIKPSNGGAVDFLDFMTLSDFFSGSKPTHILLQGYLQIDDDTTVPVSMKHVLVWDSFSPTIEFDIDRSQYEGEEPEELEEDTVVNVPDEEEQLSVPKPDPEEIEAAQYNDTITSLRGFYVILLKQLEGSLRHEINFRNNYSWIEYSGIDSDIDRIDNYWKHQKKENLGFIVENDKELMSMWNIIQPLIDDMNLNRSPEDEAAQEAEADELFLLELEEEDKDEGGR